LAIKIFSHAIKFFSSTGIPALLILLAFILCPAEKSYGQDGLNGLLQNYNAFQTTQDHELIAARNRLRLQFSRSIGPASLYAETDLIHRYSETQTAELLLRELYFDWFFDRTDLRAGKQAITWGLANGASVTNILSPVDLSEFLTQGPSDLILGVTAVNVIRYFDNNQLQFIFSPAFQQDRFPEAGSRWFPVQTIETPIPVNFDGNREAASLSTVQAAARYSIRSINKLDLDFKLLYWSHPMPAFALTINLLNFPDLPSVELDQTYRASPMAGFSADWRFLENWSLQTEALYVHQRLFTFLPVSVNRLERALEDVGEALLVLQEFELRDDGYLLRKPWLHTMFGIQGEVFGTNVSLQGYLETIFNYEDRILPQQYFPYVTALASRPFLRDRLQMLTLGRYNIFGEDFWFQLQGIYEIADGIELALGTNLFGGEFVSPFYGHFTFHQFRENSFIFSRFSLYF
jgi:hypothetical protein